MPTINYQNRQATTPFVADINTERDVLATAGQTNDYQDGMSVNGGATLHLEIDASQAVDPTDVNCYRRSDTASAWSVFYAQIVVAGVVFTDNIGGIAGFSDVRVTVQSQGANNLLLVAAKITGFSA